MASTHSGSFASGADATVLLSDTSNWDVAADALDLGLRGFGFGASALADCRTRAAERADFTAFVLTAVVDLAAGFLRAGTCLLSAELDFFTDRRAPLVAAVTGFATGLAALIGPAGLPAFLALLNACLACLIASLASRTARLAFCRRSFASLICCLKGASSASANLATGDLVLPDFKITVDFLLFMLCRPYA